jgi:transposase-like protein
MHEIPDDVKRWTVKRRQALILQLVRGETTPAEAARRYDLTVREIEEWRDKAMAAMENALRSWQRIEELIYTDRTAIIMAKSWSA